MKIFDHFLLQRKMASVIDDEDTVYIELSKNPIRFEPVSKVTNVFFDDSNRQASAYQYFIVLWRHSGDMSFLRSVDP